MNASAGSNVTLYLWIAAFIVSVAWAFRSRKNVALAACSIFACLLMLDAAIMVYEKLYVIPWEYEYHRTAKFQQPDPVLRTRLIPNAVSTEYKQFRNGEFAFKDITYKIDDHGRRASWSEGNPQRHALFFGCSYTFGMGVQTDQTLPSAFARTSKGEYRAYNYASGGNGPSQMYLILGNDAAFMDVTPKQGFAVYAYMPDHLSRAAAFEYSRLAWIKNSPLFSIEDGGLVGPWFAKDRLPTRMSLYAHLVSWSPLARQVFRVHDAHHVSEHEAMDVVARLAGESAKLYKQRFEGEFYVLIWPRSTGDLEYLAQAFEAQGAAVIRIPEMPDADRAQIHPMDAHPSATEDEWIAARLLEQINGKLNH